MCWEYCIDNFVLILWSWQQIMFGRELVSRWSNIEGIVSILSENHSALRGDLEGAKVLTCIVLTLNRSPASWTRVRQYMEYSSLAWSRWSGHSER